MTVYISGKITGLELEDAKRQFQDVMDVLEACGYVAINPFNLTQNADDYKACMRLDIMALFDCDAICPLDNWLESKGAIAEMALAEVLGLERLFLSTIKSNANNLLRNNPD